MLSLNEAHKFVVFIANEIHVFALLPPCRPEGTNLHYKVMDRKGILQAPHVYKAPMENISIHIAGVG